MNCLWLLDVVSVWWILFNFSFTVVNFVIAYKAVRNITAMNKIADLSATNREFLSKMPNKDLLILISMALNERLKREV